MTAERVQGVSVCVNPSSHTGHTRGYRAFHLMYAVIMSAATEPAAGFSPVLLAARPRSRCIHTWLPPHPGSVERGAMISCLTERHQAGMISSRLKKTP
jgi:hypothetical protein